MAADVLIYRPRRQPWVVPVVEPGTVINLAEQRHYYSLKASVETIGDAMRCGMLSPADGRDRLLAIRDMVSWRHWEQT